MMTKCITMVLNLLIKKTCTLAALKFKARKNFFMKFYASWLAKLETGVT